MLKQLIARGKFICRRPDFREFAHRCGFSTHPDLLLQTSEAASYLTATVANVGDCLRLNPTRANAALLAILVGEARHVAAKTPLAGQPLAK